MRGDASPSVRDRSGTLVQLWLAVAPSLHILFPIAIFAGALTYNQLSMMAPRYAAEASWSAWPKGMGKPADASDLHGAPQPFEVDRRVLLEHVAAMQSDDLALAVAMDLNLLNRAEFNSARGDVDAWTRMLRRWGLRGPAPGDTDEARFLTAFHDAVEIYSPTTGQAVHVRVTSIVPDLAAMIANRLGAIYRQRLAAMPAGTTGADSPAPLDLEVIRPAKPNLVAVYPRIAPVSLTVAALTLLAGVAASLAWSMRGSRGAAGAASRFNLRTRDLRRQTRRRVNVAKWKRARRMRAKIAASGLPASTSFKHSLETLAAFVRPADKLTPADALALGPKSDPVSASDSIPVVDAEPKPGRRRIRPRLRWQLRTVRRRSRQAHAALIAALAEGNRLAASRAAAALNSATATLQVAIAASNKATASLKALPARAAALRTRAAPAPAHQAASTAMTRQGLRLKTRANATVRRGRARWRSGAASLAKRLATARAAVPKVLPTPQAKPLRDISVGADIPTVVIANAHPAEKRRTLRLKARRRIAARRQRRALLLLASVLARRWASDVTPSVANSLPPVIATEVLPAAAEGRAATSAAPATTAASETPVSVADVEPAPAEMAPSPAARPLSGAFLALRILREKLRFGHRRKAAPPTDDEIDVDGPDSALAALEAQPARAVERQRRSRGLRATARSILTLAKHLDRRLTGEGSLRILVAAPSGDPVAEQGLAVAHALADRGRATLLVDATPGENSCATKAQQPETPGLGEVFRGAVPAVLAAQALPGRKTHLLPAGKGRRSKASWRKLGSVFDDVEAHYEAIVVTASGGDAERVFAASAEQFDTIVLIGGTDDQSKDPRVFGHDPGSIDVINLEIPVGGAVSLDRMRRALDPPRSPPR